MSRKERRGKPKTRKPFPCQLYVDPKVLKDNLLKAWAVALIGSGSLHWAQPRKRKLVH